MRIDSDFKRLMDQMDGQVRKCGVTMHITSAFRKEGQNIGGTVYPPASRSNHLAGHAIDMNLDTPRGWCNSSCLAAQGNSYAKVILQLFFDKIKKSCFKLNDISFTN